MKLFRKVVFGVGGEHRGLSLEGTRERYGTIPCTYHIVDRRRSGEIGRERVGCKGVEPYPSTIQIADYAPGFYVPSNWAALPLGKDRPIVRSALVNP